MRVGVAPRRHSHSQHSRLDGKGDENDSQATSHWLSRAGYFPGFANPRSSHSDPIRVRGGPHPNGKSGGRRVDSVCAQFFVSVRLLAKRRRVLGAVTRSGCTSPPTDAYEFARAPRVDSNLTPACFERRPLFLHRSARRARCGLDTTVNVTVARVLGSRRRPRCCWRRSRWRRRSRSLPRRLG